MTSTYDARGRRVGATMIEIYPNIVTAVKKSAGPDGYEAIQLGIGHKKSVKKPQLGQFKKSGIDSSALFGLGKSIRFLREVRVKDAKNEPGNQIKVSDVFSKGDEVKVSGISKGRGFQGGVRRHGFAGGPKTHGQSDRHRAPGSIGSGTTPGRVYKGKRMAGHMGAKKASVRGLEVIEVDKRNNLLVIKGGVPGHIGSLLGVTKLGRIKGYTPPPEEKPEEPEESEESDNQKTQNISESAPIKSGSESQISEQKGEVNA